MYIICIYSYTNMISLLISHLTRVRSSKKKEKVTLKLQYGEVGSFIFIFLS